MKFLIGLIFAFSAPAFADVGCPSLPCDIETQGCSATSADKAEWIVEGEIDDIINGSTGACGNGPGGLVCVQLPAPSTLVVSSTRMIKGAIDRSKKGVMVLVGASHCWKGVTGLQDDLIGRRFRFYGTNKPGAFGFNSRPGFFALEAIK